MELSKMKRIALLLCCLLFLIACQEQTTHQTTSLAGAASASCSSDNATPTTSGNRALFSIGKQSFFTTDLSAEAQDAIYTAQQQAYQKVSAIAQEHALKVVLSKKAGKFKANAPLPPLADLLTLPTPNEKELKKFFDANKHRLPPEATYEQMKGQIQNYLKGQQMGAIFKQQVEEMKKSQGFQLHLAAPLSPSINIKTAAYPTRGDSSSKVKVIEVSDYLCPHCQHAHHEVQEIVKKYGDKIQLTQINFSLRPNGLSGTFVRGALCTQKLAPKKFWEYHKLAFAMAEAKPKTDQEQKTYMAILQDGKSAAAVTKIATLATHLKISPAKFESCIKDPKIAARVVAIGDQLSKLGIRGTPLFIVNNKKLAGGAHQLEEAIKKAL